jgi:hypothetical protein
MFVALLPIWMERGAPEVLLEGNHKLEQDGVGRWGREEGGGDGLEVNQTIGSRYTNPAPI